MRLPRLPRFRLPEHAAERAVALAVDAADSSAVFLQRSYRGFWRFYRWGARAVVLLLGLAIFLASEVWLAMQVMDLRWYFVLGLFMVMAGLAFAAARPKAAFLGWLLLTPIVSQIFSLDWGAGLPALTFDRCVLYPLAVLLLLRNLVGRRPPGKMRFGEVLLVAFPLYIAACAPFVETQSAATLVLSVMQRAGDVAILYYVTKISIQTERDFGLLVGVLIAVGAYCALMAFYDHFTGKMALAALIGIRGELRYSDVGGRAAGPFTTSPGELGMFLGLALALALHASAWIQSRSLKTLCWIVICLMLPSLFWTYTRGSYLVFIVCVALMMFLGRGNRKSFAAVLVGAFLVLCAVMPKTLANREMNERFTGDQTSIDRIVAGAALVGLVADHPLFGVGIGNYYTRMERYATSVGSTPGMRLWYDSGRTLNSRQLKKHVASHSTFLTMLAEHGIVGFSMFFGAFAAFFVSIVRMRRRWPTDGLTGKDYASVLLALLVGFSLSMNTTSLGGDRYPYYAIWVLIAAAVRLDDMRKAAREEAVSPSTDALGCSKHGLPLAHSARRVGRYA